VVVEQAAGHRIERQMIDKWARIIELERRQKRLEYQHRLLKDRVSRLRQNVQSISAYPPEYQEPPTGGGGDPATMVLWLATDNENPNTDDGVDLALVSVIRVATWFDRTSNLYEMRQTTTSAQPRGVDQFCSDNFMVNFDGSEDSLAIEKPDAGGTGLITPLTPPFTYLFVTRQAATGNSDEWYFRGGAANWGAFRAISDGQFRMDNGSQIEGGTRSTDCRLFECIYDGADSALIINGVTEATGDTGSNEPDDFTIGWTIGGGETASNVYIGEHIIFQGRLTTSQRTTYYNALKTKFDISF
jgi:hypothetical protein